MKFFELRDKSNSLIKFDDESKLEFTEKYPDSEFYKFYLFYKDNSNNVIDQYNFNLLMNLNCEIDIISDNSENIVLDNIQNNKDYWKINSVLN